MRFHRPAHHTAAPSVDDDGEVQRASPCRDVGDTCTAYGASVSATQRLFGPAAVKSRSTRPGASRAVARRMVVHSPVKGLHWVGTLTTTYALQARTVHHLVQPPSTTVVDK